MKRRVLTISKPYIARLYRGKLLALAEQHRIEAGLICPTAWGAAQWEDDERPTPITTQKLPILLNGKNHFHIYLGLQAAIERFNPDYLNVEEEHYSAVTWQALRIAKQLRKPMSFYTWQNIAKNYPPPFNWIEQQVFAYCRDAFAGNQEAADILRRKGYRGNITVVPQMGIDPELFSYVAPDAQARHAAKQELGLDANIFWLGFVGRLVEEKGVQDLIAAIDRVSTTKPIGLLIVGSGPHTETLKHLAIKVRRPILFRDFAPSSAMPMYMQALDLLCLPSLTRRNWKEQFGRVLVEAMASGTNVLGSSSGEIPNVIDTTGWIFAEGDRAQLASTVAQIVQNPTLRQSRAQHARERVLERYTHAAVAKRFADVFWR